MNYRPARLVIMVGLSESMACMLLLLLLLHGCHMRGDARPLAYPILDFYEHFYHCSLGAREAGPIRIVLLLLLLVLFR